MSGKRHLTDVELSEQRIAKHIACLIKRNVERDRALQPIIVDSEREAAGYGYHHWAYCPACGNGPLFAYYDIDLRRFDSGESNYPDGCMVSRDYNFCSKCGQRLDFGRFQRDEDEQEMVFDE